MVKIDAPKGIWPACDVQLKKVAMIAKASCNIERVNALKIGGIKPTLARGLPLVVKTIREFTDKPLVFDYQKAATDIPDMGQTFAEEAYAAGVDAVILFPFGGAKTERTWIQSCMDIGLDVIVGGHMTQDEFLATEGGFINDPTLIYSIAADKGIRHFIVPGNKVESVQKYYQFLKEKIPNGKFRLSAPGFLAQGGIISDTGKVAGEYWDAIVGRDITKHSTVADMIAAMEKLVLQISE